LLKAPLSETAWEFPPDEYRRRLEGVRRRMAALGADCVFLTSEKNIRYLTGFHT
jgi:Xaa-Pro aminopeptidase